MNMASIYDFTVKAVDGTEKKLSDYQGEVLLVVNTATHCGFTPQLEGLEELQRTYHEKGFEVLGFPCNQFANQAPESSGEIQEQCRLSYGVDFPTFAKIDVNGDGADPVYVWLKQQKKGFAGGDIRWNFTKFLINRDGQVIGRFAPTTTPKKIESSIKEQL
jgi:glutathione peroxidase